MIGSGCNTCPVKPCNTISYRGSICAAQRAKFGLGDPRTVADTILAMNDEGLASFLVVRTVPARISPAAGRGGVTMATEKRLIDANKISYHESGFPKGDGFDNGLDWAFREDIEKLPTVDAVEVVHGRWDGKEGLYQGKCSVCGYMTYDKTADWARSYWHYCPNCGAKMDGGKE